MARLPWSRADVTLSPSFGYGYVWLMRVSILIGLLLATGVAHAAAQMPTAIESGSALQTRAELEELLALYDNVLSSAAYSNAAKQSARENAQMIRDRLEYGDFRLGDRIAVEVQGEPTLPDTVAVQVGPSITLPLFGRISLAGVLRSELQSHLEQELSSFIHTPVVRASGLVRMSIQGSVGQPGFYWLPADVLLSEAIMVAGGPAGNSNLDRLRVQRGNVVLLESEEVSESIRIGLTLDQLNLRAGDEIFLPVRTTGRGFFGSIGAIAGIVGSLSFLIFQLTN